MAKRQAAEVLDEDNPAALDGDPNPHDATKSGEIGEDELALARKVAKRLGWTPQEEWKRDPAKWVDAPDFLENTPRELESLKERIKRTGQAAEAAIEDARRQARIEAHAEIEAAAESGDKEAAKRAAEKLAQNSGPPPQTMAWIARNPWFETDPAAKALAVEIVNRSARAGAGIDDQLADAEAEVRKRFPEHFGRVEQPREEVKLSEARRPPAVAPGSRGGNSTPREKTFADIPAGDKALYQKHFAKRYESYGLKPEDAQARYAKTYWQNKGDE